MVSPASAVSLRQQLREAMETALRERPPCTCARPGLRRTEWACAECDVDAIWPVVEAAVSAARAETAQQIAAKLEGFEGTIGCARAIDPVLFDLQVVAHNPVQGEAMHKVIGYTAARYCAGVARGVGTDEGGTQQ